MIARLQRGSSFHEQEPVFTNMEVSAALGRKSAAFTMDRYQYILPAMHEETADRREKILFKKRRVG